MKINSITLENFGSYEGKTIFETKEQDGRNIVLIGGKNGAGKTTLFTAMRLCLYGFISMGYKSHNAYYSRAIIKLINNTVKMTKPAIASVSMDISISNGHEMDQYVLTRAWTLNDTLSEEYQVVKNGTLLDADEIADFDKFLFSIIPPELFNLYFFDGEKIADFFLEEGSNARIKGAFLTLCGYDTFDIMSKNFRRVSAANAGSSSKSLNAYLEAKARYQEAADAYSATKQEFDDCETAITNCEAELRELEQSYSLGGGITKDEWDGYLAELKAEEKKREVHNAWLKRVANDYLPFLVIRDQIANVEKQLLEENNNRKYSDFCEVLESQLVREAIQRFGGKQALTEIKSLAYYGFGNNSQHILDLSFESAASVLSLVKDILEFDADKIVKVKRGVKTSINKSAKIRARLDECHVDSVQTYMQNKNTLLQTQAELLGKKMSLLEIIQDKEKAMIEAEALLSKAQSALEEELKKESISDISSRAILMLDKLQSVLYHKQIEKIETFFREDINLLMRKTRFIDDIHIDDDFNIRIFRHDEFDAEQLINILKTNMDSLLDNFASSEAFKQLQKITGYSNVSDIIQYLGRHNEISLTLPVEIEKTSLSNGEKQIFIMALYHSLVRLCNHEVPFVIDTPFARIDTEHRQNISKHFFSKLNGQVFILSTNEEINSKHVGIMKDKISVTYMLENSDNTRTTISRNAYFEE